MERNTLIISHILILFMAIAASMVPCFAINEDTSNQASEITITDMAGRSVTLMCPVERIVMMDSSSVPELSAVYGEGFDSLIIGWDSALKDWSGDIYAKYVEKYPNMAEIQNVGSLDDNTFSPEKVTSLKPDVVIMPNWFLLFYGEATKDALAKLEQADIPVVFDDFYINPLDNSTKSMLLLGKITGKEQRAQMLADYYNNTISDVYTRLAKIDEEKPRVYIECADGGPSTYGNAYGDVAWGAIVKKASGENIAEPLLSNSVKALSPEYLIDSNPDIIILTGRNWSTPGSLKLGYTTSSEMTKSLMEPFISRPGWDTINAIKNQKVYAIYHGYCSCFMNFVALEAFAKWFYPEEFKDVDPVDTIQDYHEKFMPIDYSGVFVYDYYPQ